MGAETIARRYAAALADVVMKTGEADPVRSELKAWEELIASNADLRNVFANPSIAHSKKEGVLEALIARSAPSKTAANFLRVLLRNSRLINLPEINERFAAELEERRGIVNGLVNSAHELSGPEIDELRANLEKVTGKTVKLSFEIDRDLIGGVVARIGSTVYDGSVRTKLENFKEQLIGS